VRTKLLNTSGLIDLQRCRNNYSPEDLKNISADPSGLIRVQQISPAPETPGYVRLRFDPSPCLTRTELTLELP